MNVIEIYPIEIYQKIDADSYQNVDASINNRIIHEIQVYLKAF